MNKNSLGCIILFIVGVILLFVYNISSLTHEDFVEMGTLVMFLVSVAIVYYIVKAISKQTSVENDKDSSKSGCIKLFLSVLGILLLFGFIFNTIGMNSDVNAVIGIIVFIALFVLAALWLWKNLDE